MSRGVVKSETGQLTLYDPEKGLRAIAVAEAGEKHYGRALRKTKDPLARDQLVKAIATKIDAQVAYVVWRDRVVKHGGTNQHNKRKISELKSSLPDADPGDLVAHRWRKRFCTKAHDEKRTTIPDPEKIERIKVDVERRCQRICEQQNMGTVRGTEGTGEFERYTPAVYIEAARLVLGQIDLDPATSEMAQRTVRATTFFTAETDGLKREWHGRIWLNPPYHRELAPAFINKLISEIDSGRVKAAIVLTNNCTDTDWFLAAEAACNAICFTHGRIRFTDENGTEVLPTQGQTFFYFGPDVQGFASVFCRFGFGVVPSWAFDESRNVDWRSSAVGQSS